MLFDLEPLALFSECGLYRWRLERRWGPGRAVLCIMTNPSWAASKKPTDNTTEKCCTIWRGLGFDAHIAMNVYPFISSQPKEMKAHMEGLDRETFWEIMHKNHRLILAECEKAALIVAAWGNLYDRDMGERLALKLNREGFDLYCLGENFDGSPKHPLARGKNHVSLNQRPILWRSAA